MNRNINLQNIEAMLLSKIYTVHRKGASIEAIFELDQFKINHKTDNLNFAGIVNYTLDTEYGGGPVAVSLDFIVKNGELELNLDQVDYDKILDWKEIASESNVMHAYIDDDEEEEEVENFDPIDDEDDDYLYEEEN